MRFSIKDVIKTGFIVLVWAIIISFLIDIIFPLFIDQNYVDFVVLRERITFIFVEVVFLLVINKYLLRKNSLKWDALGFTSIDKKQIMKIFLYVFLFWILFIILVGFIMFLVLEIGKADTTGLIETSDYAGLFVFDFKILIVLLEVAILGPIVEEVIFRGGIMQALKTKFSTPVAIIGSSLAFALIHQWSIVVLPGIFIMGLLFGYLYHKFGNIYAPIGLHMLINGFNVIAVNVL